LVGRPKGKTPLGRPGHMWEDNIKMDLREIGINGVNWAQLVQDRVQWQAFVSMVVNLQVPKRKQAVVWQAKRLSAFQRIPCTME